MADDRSNEKDYRIDIIQAQLHEMAKMVSKPDEKTGMERHAQTVLAAVTIGLIGWVGMSVTESSNSIAKMEVVTQQLQDTIRDMKDELKRATSTHVTKAEMVEARTECFGRISKMDDRIRLLENGRSNP
jgi:hypothetical protein